MAATAVGTRASTTRSATPIIARPVRALAIAAIALLAACSSRSPIGRAPVDATVRASVGPAGGVVRGAGGTVLEGVALEFPVGALDRLVEIDLGIGDDVPLAQTNGASVGLRIRTQPVPGPLLAPVTVRLPVGIEEARLATDLVLAGRTGPEARPVLLACDPDLDRALGIAAFAVQDLADCQARVSAVPRRVGDGEALASRALAALDDGTDAGLVEADRLLADAQRADPFSGAATALRAFTRVAVVLNDRSDETPGLDSVGEALGRLGLDVDRRSLWARLLAGDPWPEFEIPAGAPRVSEVAAMLRERVRPVLALALDDLDATPAVTVLRVRSALLEPWRPGEREVDVTDLLAWRAAVGFAITACDWLEDVDLDFDLATLHATSIEDVLRRNPGVLRRRARVEVTTADATRAAAQAAAWAWRSLRHETDDQADDLLVVPEGTAPEVPAIQEANFAALLAGLTAPSTQRWSIHRRGDVAMRPWLWAGPGAALELRGLLPGFLRDLPLADTLPDPQFGGLFPAMTQARATELADLVSLRDLQDAAVEPDGLLGEWPAMARVAVDPSGDVDTSGFVGSDLAEGWLARAGSAVALACRVHGAHIAPPAGQTTVAEVLIQVDPGRSSPPVELIVRATLRDGFATVCAVIDGVEQPLWTRVGVAGPVLEVLFDPTGLPGLGGAGRELLGRFTLRVERGAAGTTRSDTSERFLLAR